VDSVSKGSADYAQNPWISRFEFIRVTPDNHRIYRNNKLLLTISHKGDDLESLAGSFNLSVRRLKKYNDMDGGKLKPGQIVYLEPKKRKAEVETHVKKAGETLREISQGYGIRLKMIWKRNGLPRGTEPPAGRSIRLR
jgi:LysM repeat protein